ncbi:MAG: hypothetical protein IKA83_04800 [Paludibacteraceae bacterium]|nr:hypothetical protein [Paludibacteraceae bacterium]
MKKIIIIISVAVVAIGATIAGIVSLKSNTISKETDIYSSFPEVPVSIIQINNIDELTQALLYNNNYWQDLSNLEQLKTINTVFTLVDSLKETNPDINSVLQNRKLVLSTYADGKFLWSAQVSDNEHIAIKSILSNNISNKLYFAYPADILLISDDKALIEKSIMQVSSGVSLMDSEEGFNKIKGSAGDGALVNWFVNIKSFQNTINESFKESFNLGDINHYARWCGLDIETLEDKIVVNGFAESGGEQDFLSVFSAQEYTLNTLTSRMPYNTYFFKHYALSDVDEYTQAVDSFSSKHELGYNAYGNLVSLETNTGENPLLFFRQFFDGEIAYGRTPMNEFVLVKLFSPQEAAEKLNYMVNDKDSEAKLIKKNGLDIYHFNQNGFAASVFGKQFLLEDEYMTIVDNKLIIAPTINFLTYIASRNANTQTLQCAPNFRDANKTLLSIANLSFYVNIPYVIRNAKEFFSEDFTSRIKKNENLWKNFSTFCLQAENSPNGNTFQHFFLQYDRVHKSEELGVRSEELKHSEELAVKNEEKGEMLDNKSEQKNEEENTTPNSTLQTPNLINTSVWSVNLDSPAIINPQIVKNHYNGEDEIFIQDENNQIYLISNSGKILWKKSIDGSIIGNVHQVDMLKNNKLQMAFVTENKLYIVDRNGNNLKNYPKTLSKKAIVGLSVFDYDKNKNYRFMIPTEDADILLLNMQGEVPNDWRFSGTENVTTPLQYFNIKGKDYIVTANSEKALIVNRRGENRVTPKDDTKGIKTSFFADVVGSQDRLVAAGENGKILFIYTNNQVQETVIKDFAKNFDFTLYKGRVGNYYMFYNKNGFEAYDKDFNIYLRDNSISGGENPVMLASGSKLATFDTKTRTWVLHNLVNYRKAYARYSASSALGYFGTVKPYKEDCLITTNGNKVVLYK